MSFFRLRVVIINSKKLSFYSNNLLPYVPLEKASFIANTLLTKKMRHKQTKISQGRYRYLEIKSTPLTLSFSSCEQWYLQCLLEQVCSRAYKAQRALVGLPGIRYPDQWSPPETNVSSATFRNINEREEMTRRYLVRCLCVSRVKMSKYILLRYSSQCLFFSFFFPLSNGSTSSLFLHPDISTILLASKRASGDK